MTQTVKTIFLISLALLASFLVFTVSPYWSFKTDINFLLMKQPLIDHPIWMPVFYVHLFAGTVSILVGIFQFFRFVRKRKPLHKILGRSYAYAILLLGAPTGLYMALFAEGGWLSSLGFIVMAFLWFYTTFTAVKYVKQGQIIKHKEWMIRSYAVTFSAATLRLWVPLCSYYFRWDHAFTIIITAWLSWGINLAFAEAIIQWNRYSLPSLQFINVKPKTPST